MKHIPIALLLALGSVFVAAPCAEAKTEKTAGSKSDESAEDAAVREAQKKFKEASKEHAAAQAKSPADKAAVEAAKAKLEEARKEVSAARKAAEAAKKAAKNKRR